MPVAEEHNLDLTRPVLTCAPPPYTEVSETVAADTLLSWPVCRQEHPSVLDVLIMLQQLAAPLGHHGPKSLPSHLAVSSSRVTEARLSWKMEGSML